METYYESLTIPDYWDYVEMLTKDVMCPVCQKMGHRVYRNVYYDIPYHRNADRQTCTKNIRYVRNATDLTLYYEYSHLVPPRQGIPNNFCSHACIIKFYSSEAFKVNYLLQIAKDS